MVAAISPWATSLDNHIIMQPDTITSTGLPKALFTGTFDPFTIGHADIVARALNLFSHLTIAVAVSQLKHTEAEIADRVHAIEQLYRGEPRVAVKAYSDLTVDMAHREGAQFIVRGVRDVKDYEYERQQADINRQLGGVETILLFTRPELQSVSSTLVRELRHFGRDVSAFLPTPPQTQP